MSDRPHLQSPSRRAVLVGGAATVGAMTLTPLRASTTSPVILEARPGTARLLGDGQPETAIWGYGGTAPGPVIRVRQGEQVVARLVNRIDEPTTIHWHGIRLPNAMDGVAHLTQDAVAPGASFDYRFKAPDAGTYWYHPHAHQPMQQDRGLYGLLIVEEPHAVAVDREIALVIDDWRLERDGAIETRSLGMMMDAAHAGRLGNLITVNGARAPTLPVRTNERIRLRLCSSCNARVLQLKLDGVIAQLVAVDGQPISPEPLVEGRLTLAPSQRADVVIDVIAEPGRVATLSDVTRAPLVLAQLATAAGTAVRERRLETAVTLPPNSVPEPAPERDPFRFELVMAGGAMGMMMGGGPGGGMGMGGMGGGPGMGHGMMDGGTFRGQRHGTRDLVSRGMAWTFNGVAGDPDSHDAAIFKVARGRTVVLDLVNDTAWPHAMHLHGHHFRVLKRSGEAVKPWLHDTVLMVPRERMTIAFLADNPGKWMLHCHMLEHQMAGMSSWFEVA